MGGGGKIVDIPTFGAARSYSVRGRPQCARELFKKTVDAACLDHLVCKPFICFTVRSVHFLLLIAIAFAVNKVVRVMSPLALKLSAFLADAGGDS